MRYKARVADFPAGLVKVCWSLGISTSRSVIISTVVRPTVEPRLRPDPLPKS